MTYIPLGAAAFGGAERSLLDLAIEMAGRGKRVLIIAPKALEHTGFAAPAREASVEIQWVELAPEQSLMHNLMTAYIVFRSWPARLVHFNISWRSRMWVVPLVARLFTRAKLIGSMRAMPDPHDLVPRRRYFGLIPGLQLWHLPEVGVGHVWARTLHRVVSINARDFPRRLVRDYGFSTRKMRVIYNGIRTREKHLGEAERAALRHSLSASNGDFLICYIGRLAPEKGVANVLEALARLPAVFRLVLMGEGPQQAELEALADELGISARVHFIGFVDQPDHWMAAADAGVVPSLWYEGFGRVVPELMAQAVPVVASRIGGLAELFTDGMEGLYVEPGHVDQLVQAFKFLAQDPARRSRMGEQGRRLVGERYALTRVIEQYAIQYTEMLGGA